MSRPPTRRPPFWAPFSRAGWPGRVALALVTVLCLELLSQIPVVLLLGCLHGGVLGQTHQWLIGNTRCWACCAAPPIRLD